jgi:hypothetical protein
MRLWLQLRSGFLGSALALGLAGPLPAAASTILLSETSSDETPAEALLAELRFDVVGTVLQLTVVNRTDESDAQFGSGEYRIHEIYFNATTNVTGLSLTNPASGWSLETNKKGGGEFGRFGFALIGDSPRRQPPVAVDPGTSLVFELDISGTGPFDMEDFATALSTIPPGSMPVIGSAKFINGPEDDSAFGGSSHVIPEPGAALLVTVGLAAALLRPRRYELASALSRRPPRA